MIAGFEEVENQQLHSVNVKTYMKPAPQIQEPKKENIFARALKKIVEAAADEGPPVIQLAGEASREVYCEVVYNPAKKAEAKVIWKLKNSGKTHWPEQLALIPLMSAPTVRMFFESKISPLEANSQSDMAVTIQIPEGCLEKHLIVLFRLKTNKRQFVGPTLLVFVRLVDDPTQKIT